MSQPEPHGGGNQRREHRDTTTPEDYARCCEDARKLFEALERGRDYYFGRVKDHQRDDPGSSPGKLLAVVDAMLGRSEATVEMIAALLFSAQAHDERPAKLRAFFDEFIRHPSLDLPKELARTCGVSVRWFNQWAKDYHEAGGIDIPWANEQVTRTGLSALTDNFLEHIFDLNEVIDLLEKGVIHFFKTVVRSQRPQDTVDPHALGEHSAPEATSEAQGYDYEQMTSELWYRLRREFEDNPVWRPQRAWLTAAIIDLGFDPLPPDAQDALCRCPAASQEIARYYRKYTGTGKAVAGDARLPRDSRARLRVALAALGDLLELGTPIRLHDRTYQKHKRAVRSVRVIAKAYGGEVTKQAERKREQS